MCKMMEKGYENWDYVAEFACSFMGYTLTSGDNDNLAESNWGYRASLLQKNIAMNTRC